MNNKNIQRQAQLHISTLALPLGCLSTDGKIRVIGLTWIEPNHIEKLPKHIIRPSSTNNLVA